MDSAVVSQYGMYIMFVLIGIIILLFLLCIISLCKISSLKKRINQFLKDDDKDIENMLNEYLKKVESINSNFDHIKNDIQSLKNQIIPCIQKTGIVRFNPFEDVGGDLSFAVALLDGNDNGVVISSIYSREGCYSYSKEIQNGTSSKHKLSDEEIEAIKMAKK